jgi:hypothetical protein
MFLFSQESIKDSTDSILKTIPHPYLNTGALVSYYLWEEDEFGFIMNQEIRKPFLQNFYITISPSNSKKDSLSFAGFNAIINSFAHDDTKNTEKKVFEITTNGKKEKVHFPMMREEAIDKGSVLIIKQKGEWISKKRHSVNYFTISLTNKWKFSHSSDSIILQKNKVRLQSNSQYIVLIYMKDKNKIAKEVVYSYSGEDVTDYFLTTKTVLPQRVIVFANGYRGPTRDKDESDNLVTDKDRFYYWYKIDNQFIDRLQPSKSYYIDGSMGIYTSNHRTMGKFAYSLMKSSRFMRKKRAVRQFKSLNTEENSEGFKTRKEKGKIAGRAFLAAICNSPACAQTIDTVDIVCHSMGYAYVIGFIEEIKGKVVFGNMYIIAAENASNDCPDWTLFNQVWQYGSNLGEPDADPVWEQDGIAPQCPVKGIEVLDPSKGGRVFFPKDWPKKNFIDSHMLYNYDWMFECIVKGQPGYIEK